MGAHDATAGADAGVEHGLHHFSLPTGGRQPHAEALPVRARGCPLDWNKKPLNVEQHLPVALGKCATLPDDLRQPLQLFASHGRLDVGHPVVEADHGVLFEDHLVGTVPHPVVDTHPVLSQ